MTTRRTGLREQKKQATRAALREAALRLALEHGPENVRVDDIADAAGVSPRTYNNYFSSREQAIVAAITAEREARIAEEVTAAPAHTSLADALTGAILARYTEPGDTERFLVTATPPLREAFLEAATELEGPLADAIGRRLGDTTTPTAPVLAAAVAAAVRIALHQWLGTTPAPSTAPDRL
ncbi:TetR/AcrR family transcriptional regulator, partial [Streptomyces albidoflavus]